MLTILTVALTVAFAPAEPAIANDTIRLTVGSPQVDARIYKPHVARVRVYRGPAGSAPVSEWTNELTVGDSAGIAVHRWVTRGTSTRNGAPFTWELKQTFDARTLAYYGYQRTSSLGDAAQLVINGNTVKGTRRTAQDTTTIAVDQVVEHGAGFAAGASDLVPLAVGLKAGRVIWAPVWSPGQAESRMRIFSVIGKVTVDVEGTKVESWKVEERFPDGKLYANWYLVEQIPYMVYGEVVLPDGSMQRMTEVTIEPKGR
jgi:hypothetical protein